jgi:hypothetical protein
MLPIIQELMILDGRGKRVTTGGNKLLSAEGKGRRGVSAKRRMGESAVGRRSLTRHKGENLGASVGTLFRSVYPTRRV